MCLNTHHLLQYQHSQIKMSQTIATLMTIRLLIISLTVYTVKSDSHVIVRPTDSNSSICGDYATCDTLSEIISNNLIENEDPELTLIFLNGTHIVKDLATQAKLRLERKRNVTLFGKDSAVILCDAEFSFNFLDIDILTIRDLRFSKCGGRIPIYNSSEKSLHHINLHASLVVSSIDSFLLESVTIDHSKGYGLFAYNLRNETHLLNCLFTHNGRKCTKEEIWKYSNDYCKGGSIALYFFTRADTLSREVTVSISHCTIEKGVDESLGVVSCEDLQAKHSTHTALKATGLAVIFAQVNFKVNLCIFDTVFYRNSEHQLSSAILIYDYSTVSNTVEFRNVDFSEEGALTYFMAKRNYEANESSNIFILRNCSFKNEFHQQLNFHAVHICVKPSQVLHTHFQRIVIGGCTFTKFYGYDKLNNVAIVKISYSFTLEKSFPNTLIEIASCIFSNNTAPSISFRLKQDAFLDSYQSSDYPKIFTIRDSRFELTKGSYLPLEINGPYNSMILWKYRKTGESDISFTELLNCTTSSSIQVINAFVVLWDCRFINSDYTPVYGTNSVIAFEGRNIFEQNKGKFGGALRLEHSIVLLKPNSETDISKNFAVYGGGIYATKSDTIFVGDVYGFKYEPDFVKESFNEEDIGIYSYCTISRSTNAEIRFKKNQASSAGNSIFGGNFKNCRFNCTGVNICTPIWDKDSFTYQHLPHYISIIPYSNYTRYTEVSSPATRICLCENGKPTNKCRKIDVIAFPGQEFNVSVIAIGRLMGSMPIAVTAISSSKLNIDNRLYFSSINCTTFSYSMHSINLNSQVQSIMLKMSAEGTLIPAKSLPDHQSFEIRVHMAPCPLGMTFSSDQHNCRCHTFFTKFKIKCNSKRGGVKIKDKQWVGFYHRSILAVANSYMLDYLYSGDKYVDLSKPDTQCNFNRNGVLCGACLKNLSVVLGTSNCMKCSNIYLLLIIPFAMAGAALVVLLLMCNLTVSVGYINSIIFYANVVHVNKVLLFSNQNTAYHVLSTFIAWINLDLGIEVCFFKNMDTYAKAWLQFVFPVYLWIMVGLIVVLAHYSSRMGRLIGSNSVPVLATLFLLSYTKLLRVIIVAVSLSFIEFDDGSYKAVWLHDGNIDYINSKHIALFLMALVFALFYILPLTLLVLLAPCLQARSHYKAFGWVNRLKPFLDAFQGPYSNKFRCWTGLFLVLRVLFFVIDASNYDKDPSLNFFWAVALLGPLAILCLIKRKVYRHKMANHIETITLLNIVILCLVSWVTMTTSYGTLNNIKEYATYISVVVTMLVFVWIIFYQACLKINSKCKWKRKNIDNNQVVDVVRCAKNAPTCSVVELSSLKDPLLNAENSLKFESNSSFSQKAPTDIHN